MSAATRTIRLAEANTRLMVRNSTTLLYAFAMPAFPLVLLLTAEPGDGGGTQLISTMLLMALLFPGYYNLLSAFVTRRDELVLKRLRTGEVRDPELITSLALPGAAITATVTLLAVPLSALVGYDLPLNPVLLAIGVLLAVVTFAAFAIWTAAWTRTAESAQLTSAPVILLATVGLVGPALPESFGRWLELTPGSAVIDLVGGAWFGRTADGEVLSWAATWTETAPALAVLAGWTAIAVVLARQSLRWEPRA